jgi:ureidoglycolate lyase
MKEIGVKELTAANFWPNGTYAELIDPVTIKIGSEPIEFFRDMGQLDLGLSHTASFSVCRVIKRPFIIDITEMHTSCGEGLLPLDGDVLLHAGPASAPGEVPLDGFEIFKVPKGTFVSLRPGVWHHAPFAYHAEKVNVLIVLPERAYANDCSTYKIPAESQIKINV